MRLLVVTCLVPASFVAPVRLAPASLLVLACLALVCFVVLAGLSAPVCLALARFSGLFSASGHTRGRWRGLPDR